MNILFPPRSATCRNKSSSEFRTTNKNFSIREKQIRIMSRERNSRIVLNKSYIHKPETHLPLNDSNEVSLQLHILRKNFDRACTEFTKRDTFISGLKTQLDKISESQKRQSMNLAMKQMEIQNLDDLIIKTKANQELEEENREIFLHVLDRMRTTIVHLKLKAQTFKVSLHKSSFFLSVEQEASNKSKESRAKTSQALERLKVIVENEKNEEEREVEELQKNVEQRRIASSCRAERRKNQAEIIEKAIIDSQSSRLEETREQYFLNKLWYNVTTYRYEREKNNSHRYEEAYQKLKLTTGIFEIPVFVEKFLTKEKSYRETLESVKNKEIELNLFKNKIETIQEGIDKFQLNSSGVHIDLSTKKKLDKKYKELRELNEKKMGLTLVYDKIKKWAQKMKNKVQVNCMDSVFETSVKVTEPKHLREWFEDIADGVKVLLQKMDVSKYQEEFMGRGTLGDLIEEIPECRKSFRKLTTPLGMNELLAVESEGVEELGRKISRRLN